MFNTLSRHVFLISDSRSRYTTTCIKESGGNAWFLGLMRLEGDVSLQICAYNGGPPLGIPTSLERYGEGDNAKHIHQYNDNYYFGMERGEDGKIIVH